MNTDSKLFHTLLKDAPEELKEILFKLSITPQNKEWHPEGPEEIIPHNVLIHTIIVFNNCRDKNCKYKAELLMASIFHDLGKVDTTVLNKKNKWSAPGHEKKSIKYLNTYKKWIKGLDLNFDLIEYLVSEHMRIKQIDNMRKFKVERMKKHKWYHILEMFNDCDNMRK